MSGTTSPGQWKFILDAVINANCMIKFEVIKRSGGTDEVLMEFQDSYMPLSMDNSRAQLFEYDTMDKPAYDFADGDVFVFRYSAIDAPVPESYIPNGDGSTTGGDIPHIIFP